MSGGHFDYNQFQIQQIAESIESVIHKNKVPVKDEDRWSEFDDREFYYDFSDETIQQFKEAVEILKTGYVFAQRIDWLLCGDDGEETFHERLKKDLNKL